MENRLQNPALAMRLAVGLMATLAGLDKFFNILANWGAYVSPVAAGWLPFQVGLFMRVVGGIELAVGLTILSGHAIGAYAASAWLLLVAANLVLGGHFDVAVRDVVLAVGAFVLGRLLEGRAIEQAPASRSSQRPALGARLADTR